MTSRRIAPTKQLLLRAASALIAVSTLVPPRAATASPNVPLDSAAYEELARLRAIGELPPFSGGLRPLTTRRVSGLLRLPASRRGFWLVPAERILLTAMLLDEESRPYSTAARPRDLTTGGILLACENREGRPCSDGAGVFGEVDASAGYGDWVSASIRLRAQARNELAKSVALDRAYVNTELGPIALEAGRDVLAFGPSARTQLGWGANAAPITHLRVSTSEPYELSSGVHVSAAYVVGRLRAPQRYPHDLVSIARLQLDVGQRLEFGTMQLLQVGGEGAPSMSFWDFLAEHVRRKDISAGDTDSSNRRFGGDVALQIPELRTRLYYSLIFEDIRRARLIDAVRYDADHLLGLEIAALGPSGRNALTIEWQRTGFRSQEHTARTTGFTNLGRTVGSPLGPDARSIYVGGTLVTRWATLYPSVEIARFASDTYEQIDHGPITRLTRGVVESRYRASTRARMQMRHDIDVDVEILLEHVSSFAFQPGSSRENVGGMISVFWYPSRVVAKLTP